MSFAKVLVLALSLAASASALTTPHVVRHSSHHHALAARVAAPAPVDVPAMPLRKRQNTKRCKQRSSSVQVPSSTAKASSVAAVAPTTTKQLAAPTTTKETPTPTPTPATTKAAAPTTTKKPTTTHAPTTTTKAPVATPATTKASSSGNSNLPSFLVGTQTGQGTFYATGLGACGITNTDTDHIAAVSHLLFDNFPGYNGVNPNNNPMCGRTVTATYQGKSVKVALTDRCTGCALTDLDFSPSAFNELADFAVGRISGMTWVWD